ncbi:late embryogenesis abundant protein At5g17165 [Andrographis paniculata]|uniref:late embryogenesis abundant protein At5g17165 n=1 Tax=Andrographis paniculata TaxID=175694 RepID=UPI0021E933C0|nr:late embryogenesis abundant protein At5g17165 [Andrographis paniculata]
MAAPNHLHYTFGKRLLAQIRPSSRRPRHSPTLLLRSVHESVYEKNREETESGNGEPAVVPDHVIPPQTVEYWAPHPQTGVFGPAALADKRGPGVGGGGGEEDSDSVLQQTTFFRPQEDLDKPPVELHNQAPR